MSLTVFLILLARTHGRTKASLGHRVLLNTIFALYVVAFYIRERSSHLILNIAILVQVAICTVTMLDAWCLMLGVGRTRADTTTKFNFQFSILFFFLNIFKYFAISLERYFREHLRDNSERPYRGR